MQENGIEYYLKNLAFRMKAVYRNISSLLKRNRTGVADMCKTMQMIVDRERDDAEVKKRMEYVEERRA